MFKTDQNKNKYFMRYLTIFTLLIGIVLLKTSCKKNDVSIYEENYNPKVIESKFFQLNTSITKESKSVYNYLQNLDKQSPFAVETAKKIGYPIWDKVIHKKSKPKNIASRDNLDGGSSGDTLISIIPFIKESDTVVNDVLIVKSTDADTLHYFVCDWEYSDYANTTANDYDPAEKFSFFFLAVNKEVFGYDIFAITDSSLFSKSGEKSEIIQIKNSNTSQNLFMNEECYDVTVVVTICINSATGTGCGTITTDYEYCVTIPEEGGGGGGTGGGPTGGGGGGPTGGGNTPNECPNTNFNGNCPTGWNTLPNSIVAIKNIYINANAPLTNDQIAWLNNNRSRATEIYNYFEEGFTEETIEIAREHINFMIANQNYLSFVADHKLTGDSTKMWWNDINWLRQINFTMPNNIFNFYMKITRPENKKPEEFADKCIGLQQMASRCSTYKKEYLGYITQDGKLIITDEGSSESVSPNFLHINGGVYYYYPLSLGLPSNSYYGMIIDNDRVLIPVRGIIHTHPNDGLGVEIDLEHSRSDGDRDAAWLNKEYSFITNYVIEPSSNNTYKVGVFSWEEQPDKYLNVQTGLSLSQICSYF
jgi:hypothetical protein